MDGSERAARCEGGGLSTDCAVGACPLRGGHFHKLQKIALKQENCIMNQKDGRRQALKNRRIDDEKYRIVD